MEFRNLTPFAAMQFRMLDREDNENYVIVMKVGYRLESDGRGGYRVRVRDDDAVRLCAQDEYQGAVNKSSVIEESDLSPFKPACDVIINGTACAKELAPVVSKNVNVIINNASGVPLLEKQLNITGKCYFQKNEITNSWSITQPEPFIHQPVIWEAAFGGECRIDEKEDGADSVPKADRLTDIQKVGHPDSEHAPLAHKVC